jgi:hypothetical protein
MTENISLKQGGRRTGSGNVEPVWIALTVLALTVALFAGREVFQPVRFIVWHAASLAWFAVIAVSAWGQGRALITLVAPRSEGAAPLPHSIIALGTGLGLFSLETFLLAAAGLLNTLVLTALVTAVFVPTAILTRRMWSQVRGEGREVLESAAGCTLPLSLAGLAVTVSWPFTMIPTRAFDALSYHLEVPLRYLQAGRMVDIPENLYSYTPQLNHMLYGLAMGLSGSDLAGLLNHLFFILAIATLWLGFKDRFSSVGSAWAAAIAALSPLLLIEVVNSGVDWSAAFFTLTALSLLAAGAGDRRTFILAGIMAGLAAGCRHQPLGFAIVIPAAACMMDSWISRRKAPFRNLGIFLAVAAAAASPWYIRNWVFAGDPLFPLLANLTGQTDAGSRFVSELVGAKPLSLLWKWVALPLRMVFDPLSYSMTATVGVQYLVLLPLLAVRKWRAPGNRYLLLWLIMAFLAWYLTTRTARYAMPILLLAALWLGTALAGALKSSNGWSRALKLAVAVTLVVNAGVFIGIQDRVNRSVGAAFGMISSSRYLMETYEVYPAIDYLNNLTPPPERVLFVGEMRGFYSNFSREVPSHNRPNRLLEMVKDGAHPQEMAAKLRQAGFTHILLNPGEYDRMAYRNVNAPLWRLTPSQRQVFRDFLDGWTEKVLTENGIELFKLKRS